MYPREEKNKKINGAKQAVECQRVLIKINVLHCHRSPLFLRSAAVNCSLFHMKLIKKNTHTSGRRTEVRTSKRFLFNKSSYRLRNSIVACVIFCYSPSCSYYFRFLSVGSWFYRHGLLLHVLKCKHDLCGLGEIVCDDESFRYCSNELFVAFSVLFVSSIGTRSFMVEYDWNRDYSLSFSHSLLLHSPQ